MGTIQSLEVVVRVAEDAMHDADGLPISVIVERAQKGTPGVYQARAWGKLSQGCEEDLAAGLKDLERCLRCIENSLISCTRRPHLHDA